MIYLMNSAVMPSGCFGTYRYSKGTLDQLKVLLEGEYVSCIGYKENIELLKLWTGKDVPLSRQETKFQDGDEAFVMRLKYRVDPTKKGTKLEGDSENPDSWEFAWVHFSE